MKSIGEFKDEIAQEYGYNSFIDLFNYECNNDYEISEIVTEICKKYGKYLIEECAERASLKMELNSGVDDLFIDKASILCIINDII